MIKSFSTILLIGFLFVSFAYSQTSTKKFARHIPKTLSQKVVDNDHSYDFYTDFKNRQIRSNRLSKSSSAGTDIMVANWDWMWNRGAVKTALAYDFTGDGNFDPFMIATDNTLDQPGYSSGRYTVVGFIDDFGPSTYWAYGSDNTGAPVRTGWDSQVLLDEDNGMAYLAIYDFLDDDGLIRDYLWSVDLNTDLTVATQLGDSTTVLSGGWPRFAKDGNGNFWEVVDNYAAVPLNIAVSTDGGATFTVVDSVGSNDPDFWESTYANDQVIVANGNKISFFVEDLRGGGLSGLGIVGADVSDPDSADGIYHWYSTDGGGTWQGEFISHDGDPIVSNRPGYEQNFASWPSSAAYVDKNEVTHHVRTGLNTSTIVGSDTIFYNVSFVAYWNDKNKTWIALSQEPAETYDYDYSNLCAGNFNGPSGPVVETDASGQVVAVMWTVPQFSGEVGNSDINTFVDPDTLESSVYYYDIMYAYSEDGGATWSDPQVAVSVPNEANYWVNIAGVEVKDGMATIHYTYYYDEIPGGAIVGQNSVGTICTWKYDKVTFAVTTGVDGNSSVVEKFRLEQNYPNPFNPNTTIKYTVPERSDVTLKVYDMLGKEVASLVNESKETGSYEVNFDASKLASGMYVYRLNAGSLTLSKKMMLIK